MGYSEPHIIAETKQLPLRWEKLLCTGNILLFHLNSGVWREAAILSLPWSPSIFGNGLYWYHLGCYELQQFFRAVLHTQDTMNLEVWAGKTLKGKAHRKSFYLLHDCEIMLKTDSCERKRNFVPSVVIAICNVDTCLYFDRLVGQS